MYNWNTDISSFPPNSPKYTIWKLEQLINYGLHGEKLDFKLVKKYWRKLVLDPKRKTFLRALLWGKQS